MSEVEGGTALAIAGPLNIHTVVEAENLLGRKRAKKSRSVDLSKLGNLDTPGALFLCGLRDKGVELTGVRAEHQALLDLICGLELKPLPKPPDVPRWRQLVMQLGKGADDAWRDTLDIITFVGRAASATGHALLHPCSLRLPRFRARSRKPASTHCRSSGSMAVMISVVIGYQGVAQLRPYGGEDFTINLVAVSVLREMGVLITAIMVAGRSGSAFTAEIGVMKAREEIDALKVMGIEPDGDAGRAAGDRSGHHPAAADVLRRHHGPARRGGDFAVAARCLAAAVSGRACTRRSTAAICSSACSRRRSSRSSSPSSAACTGCA